MYLAPWTPPLGKMYLARAAFYVPIEAQEAQAARDAQDLRRKTSRKMVPQSRKALEPRTIGPIYSFFK